MEKNKKDTLKVHWTDKFLIPIITILFFLIILYLLLGIKSFKFNTFTFESFKLIIDSIITFTSISIGFIGTLLGILLSIEDSKIINLIEKTPHFKILNKYIKYNIITGLTIIVISLILYLKDEIVEIINIDLYLFILSIWLTLVLFVILSTYKITSIIMDIIFNKNYLEKRKVYEDKISSIKEIDKSLERLDNKD